MDKPVGPGVRTALAMRKFFERHRRALQTAWDLAPNATIVATAVAMVVMLQDIDR
jgi:flagellar motor component MotA